MLWQDTGIAWHIVSFMLFMFLLSIQLIFSLHSFVCFPSFPIYMQVFLGLEPYASGEQAWVSATTSALESDFSFVLRLYVISISYCIMTLLCRLSVEHVYLCYVLTMRVFTTSWWVVNQLIVIVIFLYAFYVLMLVCIRPFEA